MKYISSEEELLNITEEDDVVLTDDIYITKKFYPITRYAGSFDGNGYTIYNIKNTFIKHIDTEATIENVSFSNPTFIGRTLSNGIFSFNFGTIKDVTVKNADISELDTSIGLLVSTNKGELVNCSSKGEIVGKGKCGLLTSESINGVIKNCTVSGVVKSVGTFFSEDDCGVGGITGTCENTNIENCKIENVTIYNQKAGGVSGICNESRIKNCTVVNSTLYSKNCGSIVGESKDSTIQDSLVKSTSVCSSHTVGGAVGLSKDTSLENISIFDSVLKKLAGLVNCGSIIGDCNGDVYQDKTEIIGCYTSKLVKKGTAFKPFVLDFDYKYCYFDEKIVSKSEKPYFNVTGAYVDLTYKEPKQQTRKISNSKQLENINMCDTVVLTQDIELDQYTNSIDIFYGEFNGNGHTITGLNKNLFCYIGEQALVKNFTVKNPTITEIFGDYNGTIAGVSDGVIKTVNIDSLSIETKGTGKFGGIVGTNDLGVIDKCTVVGDITVDMKTIGGITAILNSTAAVKNCKFDGNISVEGKYIGGIVGDSSGELKKCQTTGEINVESTESERVGGIVGYLGGAMLNCYSDCVVRGGGKSGGIAGVAFNFIIKGCVYKGKLSTQSKYVGGIIGKVEHCKLVKCENKGTVNGSSYVGGIVGQAKNSTIKKCKNSGETVIGETKVGGLIGYVIDTEIVNSMNNSSVSGDYVVGGLIGESKPTSTLENCYNNSVVSTGDPIIGNIRTTSDSTTLCEQVYWSNPEKHSYTSNFGEKTTSEENTLSVLLGLSQ